MSGYYALKQFWKNADIIKRNSSREYLGMIHRLLSSQGENHDPNNLMLQPTITKNQLTQLKTNYSKVLSSCAQFYYPEFLLND